MNEVTRDNMKDVMIHSRRNSSSATSQGLAAMLITLLVGCGSMAPHYQQPALPVAERYPGVERSSAVAGSTDSAARAAFSWQDVFADPDLRATIETALAHNRNLRLRVLQIAEARASRGIQRAERLPALNATAQGIRAGTPENINMAGLPGVISVYVVDAGASWELDFWGRVRSLDTAALESYLATAAAQRAFAVSLVEQVANTWLEGRELDERIDLARRSTDSRTQSYRIFKRRYEEGAATRLELAQVETLLTQAQSLLAQLQQLRDINAHALQLLLSTADEAPPRASASVKVDDVIRPLQAGLPSQLLTDRPDIIAVEHQLKAAHANIGAARAAFFPRVTLTGSLGTSSTDLDGLFAAGSRSWSFMPSISVPLFEGGRLRASLDLARVRREMAVATYEATIQTAFRDVVDALSLQQWLAEQVTIQQRALAAQQERARLAQLRYESGAVAYLEILDAQRDLLSAEQMLVQTRRQLQSARVRLFASLGGGSLGMGEQE